MSGPKPIKTWRVVIDEMGEEFVARSPARARYRAYQAYAESFPLTFRQFLKRSSLYQVPHFGKTGERILVCGKPATRIERPYSKGIYFIWDDRDEIMLAHPLEVKPLPVSS